MLILAFCTVCVRQPDAMPETAGTAGQIGREMDVAQNRPADSTIVLAMRLSGHVQRGPFDTAAIHTPIRRIYDT